MGSTNSAAERLSFEVKETAGIRRFSYPVTAGLEMPHPIAAGTKFRLLRGNNAVAAQFHVDPEAPATMTVDFNVNAAPFETLGFTLEFGDDVADADAPARKITAIAKDDEIQIDAAGQLTYVVPKDLRGLLRGVRAPRANVDWLKNTSPGLTLVTRSGRALALGSDLLPVSELKVVREGSHVCELSFKAHGSGDDFHDIRCHGTLTVPLAKSWVEIRCRLDDPRDRVAEIAAELDFAVTPQPLLVDFSCGELAYVTLRGEDLAQLDAQTRKGETGVRWQVLHGAPEKLTPFVVAAQPSVTTGACMHVMDQKLCTALAAAEFGHFTSDRFVVSTTGRGSFRRSFPSGRPGVERPEPKEIALWYHFVYFPPQISAVTSPQSMLQPLVIKQQPAGEK